MTGVSKEYGGGLDPGTSGMMETTMMEGEEFYTPETAANADAAAGGDWPGKIPTSQLCRVCANPNEYLIPIFEGEGLEHELGTKIQKHLPIEVTESDTLPLHMCYNCASTLIAWNDMVVGCVEADKKLRQLQQEEENEEDYDDKAVFYDTPAIDSDTADDPIEPSTSAAPARGKRTVKEKKPRLRPPAKAAAASKSRLSSPPKAQEDASAGDSANERSGQEVLSDENWPDAADVYEERLENEEVEWYPLPDHEVFVVQTTSDNIQSDYADSENGDPSPGPQKPKRRQKGGRFSCDVCEIRFGRRGDLRRHLLTPRHSMNMLIRKREIEEMVGKELDENFEWKEGVHGDVAEYLMEDAYENAEEIPVCKQSPSSDRDDQVMSNIRFVDSPGTCIQGYFYCQVCRKEFARKQNLERHFGTPRHRRNVARAFSDDPDLTTGKFKAVSTRPLKRSKIGRGVQVEVNTVPVDVEPSLTPEGTLLCHICAKEVETDVDWRRHLQTRKHLMNVHVKRYKSLQKLIMDVKTRNIMPADRTLFKSEMSSTGTFGDSDDERSVEVPMIISESDAMKKDLSPTAPLVVEVTPPSVTDSNSDSEDTSHPVAMVSASSKNLRNNSTDCSAVESVITTKEESICKISNSESLTSHITSDHLYQKVNSPPSLQETSTQTDHSNFSIVPKAVTEVQISQTEQAEETISVELLDESEVLCLETVDVSTDFVEGNYADACVVEINESPESFADSQLTAVTPDEVTSVATISSSSAAELHGEAHTVPHLMGRDNLKTKYQRRKVHCYVCDRTFNGISDCKRHTRCTQHRYLMKLRRIDVNSAKYKAFEASLRSRRYPQSGGVTSTYETTAVKSEYNEYSQTVHYEAQLNSKVPEGTEMELMNSDQLEQSKEVEMDALVCNFCERQFRSLQGLEKHQLSHISHPARRRDNDPEIAQARIETDDGSVVYRCIHCSKILYERRRYVQHLRVHTGERPYLCHICGKSFAASSTIKAHIARLHSTEKPYLCNVCGKRFSTATGIYQHNETHNPNRPFVCHVCGKTFHTSATLSVHRVYHRNFMPHECKLCGRRFRRGGFLTEHLRMHAGDRRYRCETCGKAFFKRFELKKHSRIHSLETKCNVCGRTFEQNRHLKSHARSHTRALQQQQQQQQQQRHRPDNPEESRGSED